MTARYLVKTRPRTRLAPTGVPNRVIPPIVPRRTAPSLDERLIELPPLALPFSEPRYERIAMLRARVRATIRQMTTDATTAVAESRQMAAAARRMAADATASAQRASTSTARALARLQALPLRTP
jgi:hypothetical protein